MKLRRQTRRLWPLELTWRPAAFKAVGQCIVDNEICKSDGTYDQEATNDGPCKTQSEAFQACFLAGLDAGQ